MYIIIGILVALCAFVYNLLTKQKAKAELLEKNEQKYIQEFKEKEEFLKKEALISAKEQLHQERMAFDEQTRNQKSEFDKVRSELSKKEDEVENKIQEITDKEARLDRKYEEVEKQEDYLAETIAKQIQELERVAQMSRDEAKDMLLNQLKDELAIERNQLIRENEIKIKEAAEEQSREILSQTMPSSPCIRPERQ